MVDDSTVIYYRLVNSVRQDYQTLHKLVTNTHASRVLGACVPCHASNQIIGLTEITLYVKV